ncbi:MAG: hypothetical protein ACI8VT_001311 [Saprospiraceae bacterium]|jgi:hypothetical protein
MNSDLFKDYVVQFVDTIITHQEAYTFIRKNKLWEGFWKYGWVSRLFIGLAILMGLKFVLIFIDWLDQFRTVSTANTLVEMKHLMGNIAFESYNFLFVGGLKYVMLILLEVLIFHICRRTLEILTGESSDLTFKVFLKAQIRMIKVVIRCFIMEMIFTILIKIAFGIFGVFDFLEPIAIFSVQCYFLGLLLMDNYNEQFHLSIKESLKYAKPFIGVSFALGLVLNLLLMVPFIGAIIGPVIGAVTVTLVMYRLSDLHLRVKGISI